MPEPHLSTKGILALGYWRLRRENDHGTSKVYRVQEDWVLKGLSKRVASSSHLVDIEVVNYGIKAGIQVVKKCHHLMNGWES